MLLVKTSMCKWQVIRNHQHCDVIVIGRNPVEYDDGLRAYGRIDARKNIKHFAHAHKIRQRYILQIRIDERNSP